MAGHSPLDHVVDHNTLELPWGRVIHLPAFDLPVVGHFTLTRYMLMEVVAASLVIIVSMLYARHIRRNYVTKGILPNMMESLVYFVRDKIAIPAIGDHDAYKHLPFLLTVFFFVLFSNLLGMVPGGASPTGSIVVTGTLAFIIFLTVYSAGASHFGYIGFFKNLVPHLEVPGEISLEKFGMKGSINIPGILMWWLMFVIELVGLLIKHFVLAVRLFINMTAGHLVLAVILGFILEASGNLFYVVTPASIFGAVFISCLELLVALLQAYIFTFLSALFIGSVSHAH
ncbi:MAG: synthase subunit a [Planctomycetota bacterium]|jgi:F-type H+-transporting ATPase subunit a